MVRVSIFEGGRPGEVEPTSSINSAEPLNMLVDLLQLGLADIDKWEKDKIVIDQSEYKSPRFIQFESLKEDCPIFDKLSHVTLWYIKATNQVNDKQILIDIEEMERLPD